MHKKTKFDLKDKMAGIKTPKEAKSPKLPHLPKSINNPKKALARGFIAK